MLGMQHRIRPNEVIPHRRQILGPRAIGVGFALALHVLAGTLLFAQWSSSRAPLPLPPAPPLLLELPPLPAQPAPPRPAPEPDPPSPAHAKKIVKPDPTPLSVQTTVTAPLPIATPQLWTPPDRAVVESTIPPPQARAEKGEITFEGLLIARIEQFRRYPAEAARHGKQGVVHLQFRMDRQGRLLSEEVARSSGVAVLDAEALNTLRRAEPLPAIPPDRPDTLDVSVPVEFSLRAMSESGGGKH